MSGKLKLNIILFLAALLICPACYRSRTNVVSDVAFALSQPGTLQAFQGSSERVVLNWVDTNTAETGYQVERSIDGVNFNLIHTTQPDTAVYHDPVPLVETLYHYRIRAVSGIIFSNYTNVIQALTIARPTDLTSEPITCNQVNLTWTDNSSNETAYEVMRSPDATSFHIIDTLSPDSNSYSDTGLVKNRTYHYKVMAVGVGPSFSSLSSETLAHTPKSPWSFLYSGISRDEKGDSVLKTSDGGYISAGTSGSFSASKNFWIVKTNAKGKIEWQKSFGGVYDDYCHSIATTATGGYIIAGETMSFGKGKTDAWIICIDALGNILWENTFGGADDDKVFAIYKTIDRGHLVIGATASEGAGMFDAWLIKLDINGAIEWQKAYGGASNDFAVSAVQTKTAYIVTGATSSFGAGLHDLWVMKLNFDGTVIWEKSYGENKIEHGKSVMVEDNGGSIVVVGDTNSFSAHAYTDFWLLKLDGDGNIILQKTYGGFDNETAKSLEITSNGDYIIAGDTLTFGYAGYLDQWIVKVDSTEGNPIWQKSYGSVYNDTVAGIMEDDDKSLVTVGGFSYSSVSISTLWLNRLNPDGSVDYQTWSGVQIKDTSSTSSVNSTSVIPNTTGATVTDTTATKVTSNATVINTNGGFTRMSQ